MNNKELRKHRKKLFKMRFNITNQILGTKPANRKKNAELRRQRPSPQERLNRETYVWPKTMSESKYNPDGSLRK
jgi:hypothetical protein